MKIPQYKSARGSGRSDFFYENEFFFENKRSFGPKLLVFSAFFINQLVNLVTQLVFSNCFALGENVKNSAKSE